VQRWKPEGQPSGAGDRPGNGGGRKRFVLCMWAEARPRVFDRDVPWKPATALDASDPRVGIPTISRASYYHLDLTWVTTPTTWNPLQATFTRPGLVSVEQSAAADLLVSLSITTGKKKTKYTKQMPQRKKKKGLRYAGVGKSDDEMVLFYA